MDWFSIILGILAAGFGLYTLNSRRQKDYSSARLNAMKSMFGENAGDKVHFIAYGIIPLVIGVMMFLKAFGISL
ncbi:MAG: hypothetical protein ACPGVH_00790 [Chitinophagales bacterium]